MAALTSGAERLAEQLADTDIAGLVKNLDQLVSNLDAVVVAFDVDGLETEAQGLLGKNIVGHARRRRRGLRHSDLGRRAAD